MIFKGESNVHGLCKISQQFLNEWKDMRKTSSPYVKMCNVMNIIQEEFWLCVYGVFTSVQGYSFQTSQNSFAAKLESLIFLPSIIFLEKGFCCWHTENVHVPKGEQIDWKERWPCAEIEQHYPTALNYVLFNSEKAISKIKST